MKKHVAVLAASVAAFCMISCSESSETLSTSTAEKAVAKEAKRTHEFEKAFEVPVGYFECNDNDVRYKLRQLAANELITYKCEKVLKVVERRYWNNDTITTYFVTTALTEKGQKLVAEEKEVEPTDDDAELNLDEEFDWSKFPEASVEYKEFPEVEEPEEEVIAAEPDDGVYDDYDYDSDESAEPQKEPSAYEKAKAKESCENVKLNAFEISIVKARNIEKTGDFTAKCEFVLEYDDVTPVGRIFGEVYDGKRFLLEDVHFQYYEDKGWVAKIR
jgi:hypothetical protein